MCHAQSTPDASRDTFMYFMEASDNLLACCFESGAIAIFDVCPSAVALQRDPCS